jgi:hypothetical protein
MNHSPAARSPVDTLFTGKPQKPGSGLASQKPKAGVQ